MSGSKIRLYGSTSGYVELAPPAVSPDAVLTLPPTFAGVGTNVVQAIKTDTFTTSSDSFTQVTGLVASITPSSATSKVLLIAKLSMAADNTATALAAAFRRDGTLLTVADAAGSRDLGFTVDRNGANAYQTPMMLMELDSPNTTSSVQYDVAITNAQQNGSSVYVNRGFTDTDASSFWRDVSSLILIEVAA